MMNRRAALVLAGSSALCWAVPPAHSSAPATADPADVLRNWYRLVLKLVRHTPTYSPPVASRSFAYLGVIAYEAMASGSTTLISLAGQLNGLTPVPPRTAGGVYSEAVVMCAALASGVKTFFGNTGPTGQRVMAAVEEKLRKEAAASVADDVVARSESYGRAVAEPHLHMVAVRWWGHYREHGFPVGVHTHPGSGTLGADKLDRAAAGAASARVGKQPQLCDARRQVLRPAATARL